MLSVKELLVEGKKIIADKEKWAQGYYAYDAQGDMRDPMDGDAVCFCSIGALWKANGSYEGEVIREAERVLSANSKKYFIVDQNDEGTHEEVMAVWDKAIAAY